MPEAAAPYNIQACVELLQVSAAAMWEEHFPPAASVPPSSQAVVERGSENQPQLLPHGLDAGSMAEPERRCVLEVEVVNRTDLVLQVCTAGFTAIVSTKGLRALRAA